MQHAKDDDSSISKLKALMLQSVSGKRDIGQCEVNILKKLFFFLFIYLFHRRCRAAMFSLLCH